MTRHQLIPLSAVPQILPWWWHSSKTGFITLKHNLHKFWTRTICRTTQNFLFCYGWKNSFRELSFKKTAIFSWCINFKTYLFLSCVTSSVTGTCTPGHMCAVKINIKLNNRTNRSIAEWLSRLDVHLNLTLVWSISEKS